MPSAWRRVEGGHWNQHLSVMRDVLDILERILRHFTSSIPNDYCYQILISPVTSMLLIQIIVNSQVSQYNINEYLITSGVFC